jgi:hypothetical protein
VASTQIGYNAAPGYDLATGLGSIDAFVLVTNWTSVSPASTGNATSSGDFSLAFSLPQMSVRRGACGSGTLKLTRLNGFTGTPSFSCSVPATLGPTTCAVVPAVSGAFFPPAGFPSMAWREIVGVLLAGAAFILAIFRRVTPMDGRPRAWRKLAPAFGLVILVAMIGCGGSNNSTPTNPVVSYSFAVQVPSTAPVASGAVTVSAAIGGITHSAQVTVTTQ